MLRELKYWGCGARNLARNNIVSDLQLLSACLPRVLGNNLGEAQIPNLKDVHFISLWDPTDKQSEYPTDVLGTYFKSSLCHIWQMQNEVTEMM